MHLPRFILTPEQLLHPTVILSPADTHHCRILRLAPPDQVLVCDGQGREYTARIASITKKGVELEIISETTIQSESGLALTLFQGFARGGKLDWVIEKATELGVSRIIPVISAYSQIKPAERHQNRLTRWQEIARQAVRQSGRTRLPSIEPPCLYAESLKKKSDLSLGIIFFEGQVRDENWKSKFSGLAQPIEVNLWVGPEGGFTSEEISLAQTRGINVVSLGPRILRSETAGIVAVALAQFYWGDLGGAAVPAIGFVVDNTPN